jgi:Protein of unknown function (DUF3575)
LKKILFLISLFSVSLLFGQKEKVHEQLTENNAFITFNPLGIVELQSTVGAGMQLPVNNHIALFTEIAAVFKHPFYQNPDNIKFGLRNIIQLRYYSKTRKLSTSFVALEARIKHYSFYNVRSFVNEFARDTLNNLSHTAVATSVGGGIVFGTMFPLSKNKKLQMELTAGIGVKQKFVKYKNVNRLYKPLFFQGGSGFSIPAIDETAAMPYLPCAIRICYLIR